MKKILILAFMTVGSVMASDGGGFLKFVIPADANYDQGMQIARKTFEGEYDAKLGKLISWENDGDECSSAFIQAEYANKSEAERRLIERTILSKGLNMFATDSTIRSILNQMGYEDITIIFEQPEPTPVVTSSVPSSTNTPVNVPTQSVLTKKPSFLQRLFSKSK